MTSRTGRSRALLCALALAALLAPSAAQAQVPGLPPVVQPPDDDDQPSRPPLPRVTPGEQAVTYGIDIGHSGASKDDSLIPPLTERWSRKLGNQIGYPLIANGIVFVPSGQTTLYALDRATGKVLWSASEPTKLLAYGSGLLFSVTFDGRVTAFAPASGQLVWRKQLPGRNLDFEDPPISLANLLFVGSRPGHSDSSNGQTFALRTGDGSTVWERSNGAPSSDGSRLFLGSCSRVRALNPSDGSLIWSRGGGCSSSENSNPLIADGRVYTDDLYDNPVLAAGSGAFLFNFGGHRPTASNHGVVLGQIHRSSAVVAHDLGGRQLWSRGESNTCFKTCHTAVISGRFAYFAQENKLRALELATGRTRWTGKLAATDETADNRSLSSMAIGEGLLAVPDGTRIRVFSSLLKPPRSGSDETAFEPQIEIGQSSKLFGAVGRSLRTGARHAVTLEADRFPYGRYKRIAVTSSRPDGTFGFRVRPTRNTAYRTRVGRNASAGGVLEVFPAYRVKFRRGRGRRINRIVARVRVRGPRDVRLRGRKLHMYLVRVSKRRVTRIGSARLRRRGRGRAVGDVRFTALRRIGRRDYFFFCIPRLGRGGLGSPDATDRRCGAGRLPY